MILKLQRINLLAVLLIFIAASCQQAEKTVDRQPNFIIIFADDMGYGDVASYGHPTIRTPNLDRMASQGQKWTNFYTAASVCTPSRAGLLTGRLPIRSGMASNKRRVLFPDSKGGLPQSENTIAKLLKQADYKTACIGKWHLGHLPEFLPTSHGFDSYFGSPYSNDMDRIGGAGYIEACKNPEGENFNVPLMRDENIIERPAFQPTIIQRYTSETVRFIEENQKDPFFIYLAHNMPHVPLFPSDQFKGKSERGIYGDVIEEIDWSVGQILESLERTGLDKNTMVIFTSDNGPWLMFQEHGGSAGLLRDGKGSTFDGGMRVPSLFYWNGTIKPAIVIDNGTTMDLLPTICSLAGVKLPNDRKYDGYDLSDVLLRNQRSPRKEVVYYRGEKLYAYKLDNYKAHFITKSAYGANDEVIHNPPLLFNLATDPSEKFDVSEEHPDVIQHILAKVALHNQTLMPAVNQLELR